MNILVTGAKGFVGKNLVEALKCIRDKKDKTRNINSNINIFECDIETTADDLNYYCNKSDFIFHLAGVNRPKNESEFMSGNFGFTSILLETLKKYNNKAPVMIASSIQAELDNPYGKSKKSGEDLIFKYGRDNGVKTLVYRFPNIFGKWCKPNYNSAVATFCYNISHNLPIVVNDRNHLMTLVYIDDVVDELINALSSNETVCGKYCRVAVEHKITLGEIVDLLNSFKNSRENNYIPDVKEGSISKKLYSTYLSYLEPDNFSYKLKMNCDERGSFTEILRTYCAGQFSVNISKPGITKGQHWHNTKTEKFLVISGHGLIQLRKIGTDDIINYEVFGDNLTVVDMIPGYTHNIINLSDTDNLVTFMWSNECFNPNKPDTFFEEV